MLKKGNAVLNIVVVLAAALLSFSAGYLVGRNFQMLSINGVNSTTAKVATEATNKVVKASMQTVSGQIAEITSDSITLTDGGDSLTFQVGPEVKPMKLLPPPVPSGKEATAGGVTQQPGTQEELKLSDLKVGDSVTAAVTVKPEGLVAVSVAVMPEGGLPK